MSLLNKTNVPEVDTTAAKGAGVTVRARAKGEYHLEHHDEEIERLGAQLDVDLDTMGKIAFAPVDFTRSGLHIIDSGTADGRWLVRLREQLPGKNNIYVGTDSVEKNLAKLPYPDISLQVGRIDTPWPKEWIERFDYVHQRLVLPGCEFIPVTEAVKNLVALVKPGGWIELLEHDHNCPNPGGLDRADAMVRAIFTQNGFGYDYPLRMKGWLEDAGLQDLKQEVIDVPLGALNPNPEMAEKSTWQATSAVKGIMPVARGLPLGIPPEELETIPDYTNQEIKCRGAIQRMYIVYGRKPL